MAGKIGIYGRKRTRRANGAKFHGQRNGAAHAGSAASQTQRSDNFSLDMILMTDA
jgi:hypothetical protein